MKYALLLLSLLCGGFAFAQPQKVVADKIVAIVGDKPILKSDITNGLSEIYAQSQKNGMAVPADAECRVIENLFATKAMVLQAEKDSLPLGDDDLEARLDNQIRQFIAMYGGKQQLEDIAGKSVFQIKEDFRQSFRENMLADMMRDKIVTSIKISPNEVKNYYDQIPKDSLSFYESEVEIGQIVLFPKASRELEENAIAELNDFKQEVESGKQKFEALARLYSDDPGSKDAGGQYNINRTEKNWDPAFISAAFRLNKPGDISPVFKSKFGYHIIMMVNRNGDDATVRHILRIPKVTDVEIDAAKEKLDSVRSKLIAGTLNFGEAVNKYSESDEHKFTGGMGVPSTIDQLTDKELVLMLDSLKVGSFSYPVSFKDERQRKGVRIVYLKSRTHPHRENLKDDYDKVAIRAIQGKREDAMDRWFATKIPAFYIMIDPSIKSCPQLDIWLKASNANAARP